MLEGRRAIATGRYLFAPYLNCEGSPDKGSGNDNDDATHSIGGKNVAPGHGKRL
jgi:hypothetical protein